MSIIAVIERSGWERSGKPASADERAALGAVGYVETLASASAAGTISGKSVLETLGFEGEYDNRL